MKETGTLPGTADATTPPKVVAPNLSEVLGIIAADRRQFARQEDGVLGAQIPGVLRAELQAEGLSAWHGEDGVSIQTVSVGGRMLEEVAPTLGPCAPTSETIASRCGPAAELRRSGVREWWTSSPLGVHQGWTLAAPADTAPDGTLQIRVAIGQGHLLSVDVSGMGATLMGSTGGLWRYQDLAAWDADEQALPVRLVNDFPDLVVSVDTRGAAWPITVDPLLLPFSTVQQKIVASDPDRSDAFGYAISSAGDLDGDGYDDLMVGAHFDNDMGLDSGSVYVYYGSASGLDTASEQKLTASDGASSDRFGSALAGGQDFDGDGYDDVAVGAWWDDDNGSYSGSAYIYYGSSTGVSLASEQKLTPADGAAGDQFGVTLAPAGDVDGDGYDDLVVGADGDEYSVGAAYVYYGSATGISASSEDKLTASDGAGDDHYGLSVSGQMDLDGDGYDDLVVGAVQDDDNGSESGSAYVYYGTTSGISASTEQKITASDADPKDAFGRHVQGVGDVDGDGLDDLLISAHGNDAVGEGAGAAYLYYGSASGVSDASEQKLTASDWNTNDGYGRALSSLDMNADGYGDVAISAYGTDDLGTDSGSVYVYFGGPAGLSALSETKYTAADGAAYDEFGYSLANAGNVDGQGYDFLAVGARLDDDSAPNSGSAYVLGLAAKLTASDANKQDSYGASVSDAGDVDADGYGDIVVGAPGGNAAYLYYGSATGISATSEDLLTASDAAAGDAFGTSVAGAGDIDGDGYDDIVVGAAEDDDNGAESGSAYVYFGSASGISGASEQKLTASDGAANDDFASVVAAAGDLDNDGYRDLVVGAWGDDDGGSSSGSAYVYYGTSTGISASSEQKVTASDASGGDRFGDSIAGGGDLDGDGFDDLLVGAQRDDDGGSNTGSVYVYHGSATGLDAATEQKLNASDAVTLDYFGGLVCLAGDVDADGYDDVLVGATGVDDDGNRSGAAYLYLGSSTGPSPTSELKLTASDSNAELYFGRVARCAAGDLDSDGYDDVIIGASEGDGHVTDGGAVYVYMGSATGLAQGSDTKLTPPDGGNLDRFGHTLSGAGDTNGDGYADIVVGAQGDDDGGTQSGSVYIYLGGCRDSDGDGYCAVDDCDDSNADAHPGGTEVSGDGVDGDCDGLENCYVDADDDGSPVGTTVESTDSDCSDTGEGTAAELALAGQEDCDDSDAAVFPGATEAVGDGVDADCDGAESCYSDSDGDGHPSSSVLVSTDTDCSDAGEATAGELAAAGSEDCNDTDASIYPGATEGVGDEVDSDCDGAELCYLDNDDDDSPLSSTLASSDTDCVDAGEGTSAQLVAAGQDDCDDGDASIHPGASEGVGDGVDSDCDGAETCYVDADDDTYPVSTTLTSVDTDCSDSGEGTSAQRTAAGQDDCNDTNASIFPGAPEAVGDSVDADCDGGEICYTDGDNDGFPTSDITASTDEDCSDPGEATATELASSPQEDCNDSDSDIHPNATETPGDEVDSDCDGAEICFADADDDDYPTTDTTPSGDKDCSDSGEGSAAQLSAAGAEDCDDGDPSVHPGATEQVGDSVDTDCDGAEICFTDTDKDSYPTTLTLDSVDSDCSDPGEGTAAQLALAGQPDCDDADPTVHPAATEATGDGIDSDCDGTEICYADQDQDGFTGGGTLLSADTDCTDLGERPITGPGGDCDDSAPDVNPGASEVCDTHNTDEDCDGLSDDKDDSVDPSGYGSWTADADGDGYGDPLVPLSACDQPASSSSEPTDCNDADPSIHPGATDAPGDGVDQDCTGGDATTPEVENPDSEPSPSGWACSATPSGPPMAPLGLLALFIGSRRRRRRGA